MNSDTPTDSEWQFTNESEDKKADFIISFLVAITGFLIIFVYIEIMILVFRDVNQVFLMVVLLSGSIGIICCIQYFVWKYLS